MVSARSPRLASSVGSVGTNGVALYTRVALASGSNAKVTVMWSLVTLWHMRARSFSM